MKKLLGSIIAGSVILLPAAAMAASVTPPADTGANVVTTPIFIINPTSSGDSSAPASEPAPALDKKAAEKAAKDEKKAAQGQAKDEKKAAHDLAEEAKRIDKELRAGDNLVPPAEYSAYFDATIVNNGGWKLS